MKLISFQGWLGISKSRERSLFFLCITCSGSCSPRLVQLLKEELRAPSLAFFLPSFLPSPPLLPFFLPSFLSFFLGPHPRHMEVPKPGAESELQQPAHTTATATPHPSYVCDLHRSSQQCWILNPLSEAWDWTSNLIDTSQVLNLLSHNGHSQQLLIIIF